MIDKLAATINDGTREANSKPESWTCSGLWFPARWSATGTSPGAGFPGRAEQSGTSWPRPRSRCRGGAVTSNGRLVPGHEAVQAPPCALKARGSPPVGWWRRPRAVQPAESPWTPGVTLGAPAAPLICTKARRIWARASRSVATSGPSGRPGPPPGRRRRRWPGRRRPGSAARPTGGWRRARSHGVVEHHDLGRRLGHPSPGLVDLGPQRLLVEGPALAHSAHRLAGPVSPDGVRPTGCSPSGVQRLLTSANLPGTIQLQEGSGLVRQLPRSGRVPTRPPGAPQALGVSQVDARRAPRKWLRDIGPGWRDGGHEPTSVSREEQPIAQGDRP